MVCIYFYTVSEFYISHCQHRALTFARRKRYGSRQLLFRKVQRSFHEFSVCNFIDGIAGKSAPVEVSGKKTPLPYILDVSGNSSRRGIHKIIPILASEFKPVAGTQFYALIAGRPRKFYAYEFFAAFEGSPCGGSFILLAEFVLAVYYRNDTPEIKALILRACSGQNIISWIFKGKTEYFSGCILCVICSLR